MLHQISMELPVSCKKFFYLWSAELNLGQTFNNRVGGVTEELLLMSKFWQKWNVLIEHMQLITTSHSEEWHF